MSARKAKAGGTAIDARVVDPNARHCDWPGCAEKGDFRAPKSRDDLKTYHWFCLGHVRVYNATWNYYSGMNDAEVEADVRRDTVWQRPTWPLGQGPGRGEPGGRKRPRSARRDDPFAGMDDLFGLFGEKANDTGRPVGPPMGGPERQAMSVLGLVPPLEAAGLKARYKQLVKKHHPDANGGDKKSEEKMRAINEAYKTLMAALAGAGI